MYIELCLQLSLLLFARMSATNVRPRSGAHVPLDCERAQRALGTVTIKNVTCCSLNLNLDESRCTMWMLHVAAPLPRGPDIACDSTGCAEQ